MINTWFTRITEGNGASHENKISEAKSFEFKNGTTEDQKTMHIKTEEAGCADFGYTIESSEWNCRLCPYVYSFLIFNCTIPAN